MTKYLLKELEIAEDELTKLAPNSRIKASVIQLPSTAGNELRLHIEFAARDNTITHGAGEAEVRSKTKSLLECLQQYIARYAKSLEAET